MPGAAPLQPLQLVYVILQVGQSAICQGYQVFCAMKDMHPLLECFCSTQGVKKCPMELLSPVHLTLVCRYDILL